MMWSVKGSFVVSNIPAGVNMVTVAVDFEKRVNGGDWEVLRTSAQQNVNVTGGTASGDTGFQPANNPVSGEEWRVKITASWIVGMPPNHSTTTLNKSSTAITP